MSERVIGEKWKIPSSSNSQSDEALAEKARQKKLHRDITIMQQYPVIWSGYLWLKGGSASVQAHFVSGNPRLCHQHLPRHSTHDIHRVDPLRVRHTATLADAERNALAHKIKSIDEHCILLAFPCADGPDQLSQQCKSLSKHFLNYLRAKRAAGVVTVPVGSDMPTHLIALLPTSDFTRSCLCEVAPDLADCMRDAPQILICIVTLDPPSTPLANGRRV